MLAADNLFKNYGAIKAVAGVSVNVAPGQIVGLVGNNGAGKTTVIKMLCGLLEPSSGTVALDGKNPLRPPVRQNIGFLPEDSPLYDDMSPLSYLRFFGRVYKIPTAQVKQRSTQLLTRLRLDESHWKKPIGQLSKGSARKVAVARAMLHDPPLLVLDEPRSGLDPATQMVLDEFLLELKAAGKAIVLSAHDLDQVERLCDEIVVIDAGKVALRGNLEELRKQAGATTYIVRAAHEFEGSRPDGTSHIIEVSDWHAVEGVLANIRTADATILDVRAAAPRLADVLRLVN